MMILYQILSGFLGGILGGMGMGGGTLLIPILVIFLNMDQKLAQGINLLSFLVMALITLSIHFKNNLIEFKVIIPIVIGGVLFSIFGATLLDFISNEKLKIVWGILLLILGFLLFLRVVINRKRRDN